MASDGLTPTEGRWITLSELAAMSRVEDQSWAVTWWELVPEPVDPMSGCPSCEKPILVSSSDNEWACSDPDCERAHGDGPGGGTPL